MACSWSTLLSENPKSKDQNKDGFQYQVGYYEHYQKEKEDELH